MRVLVVQSSPPRPGSLSRALVDEAVAVLRTSGAHEFRFRDLGAEPFDHVDAVFIEARHEAAHPSFDLSDAVIAEWTWADLVLVGSPMQNLTISSVLKAYIDRLLRTGASVDVVVDAGSPMGYRMEGKLGGRRVLCLLSRGGHYGGAGARHDFQKPYLADILGFTGVETDFIAIEGPLPEDYAVSRAAASTALGEHPWLSGRGGVPNAA